MAPPSSGDRISQIMGTISYPEMGLLSELLDSWSEAVSAAAMAFTAREARTMMMVEIIIIGLFLSRINLFCCRDSRVKV